jgi:hypothetical protein
MKIIRNDNPAAKVFWVNVGKAVQKISMNDANQAIQKYSTDTSFNYTVVDWHSVVFPSGGAADMSMLDVADGKLYNPSTPKGVDALVSKIADAFGKFSGSGAPITGTQEEKNAAIIWNYLTGQGLTAQQAAGIIGNLQAESGIEPAREQNSPSGSITLHMKIDGVTGYGIAQWTSLGRQQGLHAAMVSAGKADDTDINVQIAYYWHELSTAYSNVLSDLKKATTIRAAAVVILTELEIPSDQSKGVQDARTGFAEHWFKYFEGYSGDSAGNCPDTSNETGACIGGLSITATALCLAWNNSGHGPNQSDATQAYQDAKNKYNPSVEWSDCGGFVATVMIASGVDKNYVNVGANAQRTYVEANPTRYEIIHTTTTRDLQPGDIFVSPNHTYIFVGDGAAGGNSRSASLGGHVPEASNAYFTDEAGVPFTIARLKQ